MTVPLSQEVPDGCLAQALLFVQELGHGLRGVLQKVVFFEILDPLRRQVELAYITHYALMRDGPCRIAV